jgi:hypothetical protein
MKTKRMVKQSGNTEIEPASSSIKRPVNAPSHDEIAAVARSIWEQEGRLEGHDLEYWLAAEAQLRQSRAKKPGS